MNNVLKFPFILPVLCFCMFSCRQLSPGPDDNARITGTGGVILAGKYVPPASPDKLTQRGYGYLLYDLRGHVYKFKSRFKYKLEITYLDL